MDESIKKELLEQIEFDLALSGLEFICPNCKANCHSLKGLIFHRKLYRKSCEHAAKYGRVQVPMEIKLQMFIEKGFDRSVIIKSVKPRLQIECSECRAKFNTARNVHHSKSCSKNK